MGRTVNLVVSCTNRKRYEAAPGLAAQSLVGTDVQKRLENWRDRLRKVRAEEHLAEDLYMGEHFSVVRDILPKAKSMGWNVCLWICSAGYGLIQPNTSIKSYQAAFSPSAADFIGLGVENGRVAQRWWSGVCSYEFSVEQRFPRSLGELARHCPRTPMIVALSADYLAAVEEDLLQVLQHSFFERYLSIISSGTRANGQQWKDNLLPCDGSISGSLGGTLSSLNARVARFIFGFQADADPTVEYLSALVRSIERRTDAPAPREQQSDAQIARFIESGLRKIPLASKSKLLDDFRASGKACEQKRFGEIYLRLRREAQPELHD